MKKLSLSTLIGLGIGLFCVVSGIYGAGHISSFVNLPSIFIICGGSAGALITSFPPRQLKTLGSVMWKAFKREKIDFKDIKEELESIKRQTSESSTSIAAESVDYSPIDDEFDRIYEAIKEKIYQSGYSDSIQLERTEGYIKFQFKDNVLFYPDSPVMRETSFDILQYMGDLLSGFDSNIASIEISGHTAKVGGESKTNFFAWELSSDRAIAVLKFFVRKCDLPQSKMIVIGNSHYLPVSGNDREEDRSQNRRVEIKIIRVDPES